jgi:hypothetical protein
MIARGSYLDVGRKVFMTAKRSESDRNSSATCILVAGSL